MAQQLKVFESNGRIRISDESGLTAIAEVFGGRKVAALMVAAPELLAACKALKKWCDMCGRADVAWPGTLNEAIMAAEAAVAKAEGGLGA